MPRLFHDFKRKIIIEKCYWDLAQLEEQQAYTLKVGGSSPLVPTQRYMKIDKDNLFWLAGFLEGEGSFLKGPPSRRNIPELVVTTTDKDIACKVGNIFKTSPCYIDKSKKNLKWKDAWMVRTRGIHAVEWMKMLFPLMGSRRQQQIKKAIDSYQDKRHRIVPLEKHSEIVQRLKKGEKVKNMATQFAVHESAIYQIVSRYNKRKTMFPYTLE